MSEIKDETKTKAGAKKAKPHFLVRFLAYIVAPAIIVFLALVLVFVVAFCRSS